MNMAKINMILPPAERSGVIPVENPVVLKAETVSKATGDEVERLQRRHDEDEEEDDHDAEEDDGDGAVYLRLRQHLAEGVDTLVAAQV